MANHNVNTILDIYQVHLFTGLQLLCFVSLWLIQTFKQTSILFPIMLVLLIGVRKLLDFVFTPKELKVWFHDTMTMTLAAQVLDDMLPASKRAEMLDLEQLVEEKVDGGQIHSGTTSNMFCNPSMSCFNATLNAGEMEPNLDDLNAIRMKVTT